jgi:hypothetical protein
MEYIHPIKMARLQVPTIIGEGGAIKPRNLKNLSYIKRLHYTPKYYTLVFSSNWVKMKDISLSKRPILIISFGTTSPRRGFRVYIQSIDLDSFLKKASTALRAATYWHSNKI